MSPLYRITFNYGAPHEMYFVTDDPMGIPERIMPDEGMRNATAFLIEKVDALPENSVLSFPRPLSEGEGDAV